MWVRAIKNKLIDENLTRIEIHGILLESILSPVVFLSSISFNYLPTSCILHLDNTNSYKGKKYQ